MLLLLDRLDHITVGAQNLKPVFGLINMYAVISCDAGSNSFAIKIAPAVFMIQNKRADVMRITTPDAFPAESDYHSFPSGFIWLQQSVALSLVVASVNKTLTCDLSRPFSPLDESLAPSLPLLAKISGICSLVLAISNPTRLLVPIPLFVGQILVRDPLH